MNKLNLQAKIHYATTSVKERLSSRLITAFPKNPFTLQLHLLEHSTAIGPSATLYKLSCKMCSSNQTYMFSLTEYSSDMADNYNACEHVM
jgi:hypothetical protein